MARTRASEKAYMLPTHRLLRDASEGDVQFRLHLEVGTRRPAVEWPYCIRLLTASVPADQSARGEHENGDLKGHHEGVGEVTAPKEDDDKHEEADGGRRGQHGQ